MKKLLLVSNKVYHYRIPIYNHFAKSFLDDNVEFILLTNEIQKENPNKISFNHLEERFSLTEYINIISKMKPDAVIFYMHLKDYILWPLMIYLKIKNIPFIKWGHGINLLDKENEFKKLLFNSIHYLSKAIILYSPNEKKFIPERFHEKVYIAYNTLNFTHLPNITETKDELKKKYELKYNKIVLFVGRILENKKLDILLDIFSEMDDQMNGLVIVGPNIKNDQLERIKYHSNIQYLGEIYDHYDINSIFKMSDVFCIPGKNGLGINQAMIWGLPVVTMQGIHAPEIYYLKNDFNGFLVNDNYDQLKETIVNLLNNDKLLNTMSTNAYYTMSTKGHISNMYKGFSEAFSYVLS